MVAGIGRGVDRRAVLRFLLTGALGTALHFFYDWTGGNPVAAAFSAVNESTWEHMKLLFVPAFLLSVAAGFTAEREPANFWAARALSCWVGTLAIPALFYTYTGALGKSVTWVDVSIFFAADALCFWLDAALRRSGRLRAPWMQILGLALMWGGLFLFVWCTFRPPHLPLWQDPLTGLWGIP